MAFDSDLVRTKTWGTEVLTAAALHGQLDLIINWIMSAMNASTGHDHDGSANHGPLIDLTTGVTGVLPEANGGTSLSTIYPIGCIYTTTVSTNPATVFGFGTWTAFGSGRCLVGLDAGQTEFDTVEETGGSKTHTLTTDEIPAHTHTYDKNSNGAGSAPGSAETQSHVSTNSGSTGGGTAHNNLQPYITVYFFKRTA